MLVEELNRKHPGWTRMAPFWERVDLLRVGGFDLLKAAATFLRARPMEPSSVYQARVAAASYQNIFGTAIGWYSSRFFHEPPQFHFRNDGAKFEDDSVAMFLQAADRKGQTLLAIAQQQWFAQLLSFGAVYVVLDLPAFDTPAPNARAQRESGALDPYIVTFDPRQVYDWGTDEHGNLTRVVIATFGSDPDSHGSLDRWYVYDRESVSVYEAKRDEGGRPNERAVARLVRHQPHPLSAERRLPVRRLSLPDELWFGWRVYPQVVAHFNADNAYQWLLEMSCLPVPVITGEYNGDAKRSEVEWIHLAEGGKFSYTEPSGVAFQWAAQRSRELREEIHRQMYLQAQARSTDATPAAASGLSKQADMQPSNEVLDGFGAFFRDAFRDILQDVLLIRGNRGVAVDVQGFHFETDELGEVQTAQAAIDLGVPSETFKGMVYKAVAKMVAKPDPDTQKKIDSEIDAAPSEAERQRAAVLQHASVLAGEPPRPQAE